MTTIDIDFGIDDRWPDVHRLVECLQPLIDPTLEERDWVVDLTGTNYLGPDAAVLVYGYWLRARKVGRSVDVRLPTHPDRLVGFCRFSGLEHYINRGQRPQEDHHQCETVPLKQIFQAKWDAGRSLVKLVRRHMSRLSNESEEYLQMALQETIQNVEDHANSPVGGIWCGRFFRNRREVCLAAVDFGEGVLNTLCARYPEVLDSAQAIENVLKGGWSSRSKVNNMGLGISHLAAWTRQCEGTMDLLSGDAVAHIRPEAPAPVVERLPFFFQGTGIFLALKVEESEGDQHGIY